MHFHPTRPCRSRVGAALARFLMEVVSLGIFVVSPLQASPFSHGVPDQASHQTDGLTAFRPQHGAGYAPFVRTAVPETEEEDPALGPGIRINGLGELDPAGEDDLIEVVARQVLRNATLVLERSGPELAVWLTRTKEAGTEVPFTGNRSAPLAFSTGPTLQLWVEWIGAEHGFSGLALQALEPDAVLDRLTFHSFQSIVVALGGEGQMPVIPPDPNHGTFIVAIDLYPQGYDVHMYDEDKVGADGSGLVYDEIVNAIQFRGVDEVAIFGYSHGGGSTHDLAERLDAFRAGIGAFSISFTSYVDGIENDSDTDVDPELRYPPSSAYHANQYQRGSFADFFLDGGPVPGSDPPPTGLDVETTFWGVGATHFIVDDYMQVRDFILLNLDLRMIR